MVFHDKNRNQMAIFDIRFVIIFAITFFIMFSPPFASLHYGICKINGLCYFHRLKKKTGPSFFPYQANRIANTIHFSQSSEQQHSRWISQPFQLQSIRILNAYCARCSYSFRILAQQQEQHREKKIQNPSKQKNGYICQCYA